MCEIEKFEVSILDVRLMYGYNLHTITVGTSLIEVEFTEHNNYVY